VFAGAYRDHYVTEIFLLIGGLDTGFAHSTTEVYFTIN
jgi:hypothetical protein